MSKWIFFSSLAWLASVEVYPWLLTIFHGVKATAVFGACVGTIALSRPIVLAMYNILEPLLAHAYAEGRGEGLRRSAVKASKYLSGMIALLAIPLLFFAEQVVVLIYGHKYSGYGRIVQILALNTLMLASGFPFARALFTIERADIDFIINLFSLLLTASIGVWMVQHFAMLGAAISLLISNSCGSILKFLSFLYFVGTKYKGVSEIGG
jgi:O-antigen/teichoic acid export membrane protein